MARLVRKEYSDDEEKEFSDEEKQWRRCITLAMQCVDKGYAEVPGDYVARVETVASAVNSGEIVDLAGTVKRVRKLLKKAAVQC